MIRRRSKQTRLVNNQDENIQYHKIKYIINFLKYYKTVNKMNIDSDLYLYILGEIDESESKKIIEEIIGKDDSDRISRVVNTLSENRKPNVPAINSMISNLNKNLAALNKKSLNTIFSKKLEIIKKYFALNEMELEILISLYLLQVDDDFSNSFSFGRSEYVKKISHISVFLKVNYSKVLKLVNETSKFRGFMIIDDDLEIDDTMIEFIHGVNESPLSNRYYNQYKGSVLSICNFKKLDKEIEIIEKLTENKEKNEGLNMLLYGEPGTGKTEFSRSLAKYLNKDIYEIGPFDKDGDPVNETRLFSAFNICRKTIPSQNSVIVIDEADQLLNGSGGLSFFNTNRNKEKNFVNKALDDSEHISIWITNEYKFMEESTRRRFDYSIKFKKLTTDERKTIWQNSIRKYNLENILNTSDVDYLSDRYRISAGGINLALKNSQKLGNGTGESICSGIETVLTPYLELMGRQNNVRKTHSKNYSLEGLNIAGNFNLERVIDISSKFYSNLHSSDNLNTNIFNMNLLLYGVPGTGKTEFVKHYASQLKKEVIIKTGSDLLNKYVGGTEENIKNAFLEAESGNSILFIDEVDGLFSSRENAARSWEITQVNELLTKMENFKGIFIAATNFQKNMDTAAMRRFNIKLKFNYLNNDGKIIFFNRILQNMTDQMLNSEEVEMLNEIDSLTPGDYKVVWQKYAFLAKEELSNKILINELADEVSMKIGTNRKSIGF